MAGCGALYYRVHADSTAHSSTKGVEFGLLRESLRAQKWLLSYDLTWPCHEVEERLKQGLWPFHTCTTFANLSCL